MKFVIRYICFSCLLIAGLSSCSPAVNYEAGLYTKSVKGNFTLETAEADSRLFILVLDYHRTFIETSEGNLNSVTAYLVHPDEKGNYSAPYSTDTVKLELTFYAHNSQARVQAFSRSLGVGSYNFDVKLKEDKDWQNTYLLMIKPTLVEYIIEQRFQMNQFDKSFIGEWLSIADKKY